MVTIKLFPIPSHKHLALTFFFHHEKTRFSIYSGVDYSSVSQLPAMTDHKTRVRRGNHDGQNPTDEVDTAKVNKQSSPIS